MRWTVTSSIRSALTAAFVLGAAGLVGCHIGTPSSVTVPLQYSPNTDASSGSFTVPNNPAKLYVAPVTDGRDNKDLIGENEENEPKTVPVSSEQPPANFVHDAIVSQLKASGVSVVDSQADADRVLNLTLVKFWAVENPNYHATVQLTGTLTDKDGSKSLWTGGVAGEDSTFGKSLSAENYNQVLSNAISKATSNLLKQPEFFGSLSLSK